MVPDDDTYSAPFYIFRAQANCWKCRENCPVVALASGEGNPFLLSNIESMPDQVLAAIRAINPNYELRTSRTAESQYFMNTCPCGAHFGDFYLYCEPGGAFFPTTEAEAARIEVMPLPFQGEFSIVCSPGIGTGDLILQHGKQVEVNRDLPK